MRYADHGGVVLAIFTLLVGCAAGDGAAAAGTRTSPPVGEGSFHTSFEGVAYDVDYTGFSAEVKMKHRLAESGPACVGAVDVTLAGDHEVCKLVLGFEPSFSGGLVLKRAEFHAKVAQYQGDVPIYAYPCEQFADMGKYQKGYKPAVFKLSEGEGVTLGLKPLSQPAAGRARATLRRYELNPVGTAKMKMGGKLIEVTLDGLKVVGDVTSEGSEDLPCAATYLPPADLILKDVNPRSPTYGQDVDVSSDFEGKYVALLMGAGW